jgi:hypothetical protein
MRRRAFLGAGAALGLGLALPKRLRADASLMPVRFAVNFTYQGIHAMWGTPRSRNQPINASGSLATFASRTIRPVASTTHTLLSSSDTSIPA